MIDFRSAVEGRRALLVFDEQPEYSGFLNYLRKSSDLGNVKAVIVADEGISSAHEIIELLLFDLQATLELFALHCRFVTPICPCPDGQSFRSAVRRTSESSQRALYSFGYRGIFWKRRSL